MNAEQLRTIVETERDRFEVPGCAVVVVTKDEVLLCEGFGERTIGGAPVTADTHFPIASDTKNFTAAALCVQADQGLLDLDAPVRDIIPWFEMADLHATALVSPRDLLAHRTGLPRHDFVWYGGPKHELTLEQIARSLKHLPLSRQLRQEWQYNNLCYATAGYLTEVVAGTRWSEAVRELLLTPIGMKSTYFDVRDPSVTELATPYRVSEDGYAECELPAPSGDAPAGAIVSTAADLALWLQARLGGGALSDGVLQQLHGSAMVGGGASRFPEMAPMAYALGCRNASLRGHRVVLHGGNLMGYSSQVLVAPEDGIGVAVLTNLHATALRDTLPLVLVEAVLGLEPVPWGERFREAEVATRAGAKEVNASKDAAADPTPPSRPLEDFAGTFTHPAYGDLVLSVVDGALVPQFHDLGDRVQVLHRGRDRFDLHLTEFEMSVALIPQLGAEGEIAAFAVAIEPLCPPVLFTRAKPTASQELLGRLVGGWTMGPLTLTIRTRGDGLVAEVPSMGALPLEFAGGQSFTSPVMPALRVTLRENDLLVEPVGAFTRVDG